MQADASVPNRQEYVVLTIQLKTIIFLTVVIHGDQRSNYLYVSLLVGEN